MNLELTRNIILVLIIISIITLIVVVVYCFIKRDSFENHKLKDNIDIDWNLINGCINKRTDYYPKRVLSCFLEYITGILNNDRNNSYIAFFLNNIGSLEINEELVNIATCPDKSNNSREICYQTGGQCACGWGGFAPCQAPKKWPACPRNKDQQCSVGAQGSAKIRINSVSHLEGIQVDSIDKINIDNILKSKGNFKIEVTINVKDVYFSADLTKSSAKGYVCPVIPEINASASTNGLGSKIKGTIKLSLNINLQNINGDYVIIQNSDIDYDVKSIKLYNGTGSLTVKSNIIPGGKMHISNVGDVLVTLIELPDYFLNFVPDLINSLKVNIVGPLNNQLKNLKIPIGDLNNTVKSFNNKNINNTNNNNNTNTKFSVILFNNKFYSINNKFLLNSTHLMNPLFLVHGPNIMHKINSNDCTAKGNIKIIIFNNILKSIIKKLKPTYDLSKINIEKIYFPDGNNAIGDIIPIQRSDKTYVYVLAYGLFQINLAFEPKLKTLEGLNNTNILIKKEGICVTEDKKVIININLSNEELKLNININGIGNLFIPGTTIKLTINSNPNIKLILDTNITLNGVLDDKNIVKLDEDTSSMIFNSLKTNIDINLSITSSNSDITDLLKQFNDEINETINDKLKTIIIENIKKHFADLVIPPLVKTINNSKIKI